MDQNRPGRPRVDPVLAGVLIACAVLLFWGLGKRDLWQDEAETAMLAKNILRFKWPVVFDGVNLVSSEVGKDFGPDGLWRWSPWLQLYMAAGSMALFGIGTVAARLPFALLGLLCLPLTYAFALRSFDSKRVARLSALLLGLSVPFLLHCRQARWYSLAYLLTIGLFFSLFELERSPRAAPVALALCAALLFHTNYLVAIGLLLALGLCVPILRLGAPSLKRLVLALGASAVAIIPGIIFFDVLGKTGSFSAAHSAKMLEGYVGLFFTQLSPLPFVVLLAWILLRKENPAGLEPPLKRRAVFLLACSGAYLLYLSLTPWLLFRYLTTLLPLCAVLLALTLDWAFSRNRALGGVLLILLLGSDVFHRIPLGATDTLGARQLDAYAKIGPVSFPLAGLLHEITHEFADCSQAIARHLKEHAKPSDTVLITYGDAPLQFYTGLKIVGAFQGRPLDDKPDWIVIRPDLIDKRPGRDVDVYRFILQRIDASRYEKVPLACQDAMLGSCPEPLLHRFRLPAEGRAATFLRRKSGPGSNTIKSVRNRS